MIKLKWLKTNSLTFNVVIASLIISLVPMWFLYQVVSDEVTETMMTTLGKGLEEKAFLVAEDIDRLIHQRESDIRLISQADVLEGNDKAAIIQFLTEVVTESEFIDNIGIIDINGYVTQSSGDQHGHEKVLLSELYPAIYPLFKQAKEAQQGNVFVSEAIQLEYGMSLAFMTPITDDSNTQVIKVLMIEVNLNMIGLIINDFNHRVIGNKHVYIVDNGGKVIISSDPSLKRFALLPDLSNAPLLRHKFEAQGEVGSIIYQDIDNDKVLAGFADMDEFGLNQALDWSIIAIAPVSRIIPP